MTRYESADHPSTMPKDLEHVIYEKKGHVAYVTKNRRESRNALHSYAYALRGPGREVPCALQGRGFRMREMRRFYPNSATTPASSRIQGGAARKP